MLLNNLMEGETISSSNLLSSIKRLNGEGREHGAIKALLKNFILPDADNMAIKDNAALKDNEQNKCVYMIPIKTPTMSERIKSINEAKQAFLNSTVNDNSNTASKPVTIQKPETTLHYAQIAITTESEDTRSTGGGDDKKKSNFISGRVMSTPPLCVSPTKKRIEPQQRRVSFKIKNSSTSRRPPLATTKTMTITSSKVSELTKKFNDLVNESHRGLIKPSKLAKTIETLQTASRCSGSGSSTTSSTLGSSPNIKIVLRHKRGSKRRSNKKRCSSMDSIDKLIISDSSKIKIIRSKSDGNKTSKISKKRLKYHDSSEQQSGSDSVDGTPVKSIKSESPQENKPESNVVKNVIRKFECEIAQSSPNTNTLKRQQHDSKDSRSTIVVREKPKVPEKKSTLVLTKNIVVKDGIPKIKTLKAITSEAPSTLTEETKKESNVEGSKRKEPIYDKKKYKTNYIHSDKLPLHIVEIIQEDINESSASTLSSQELSDITVVKTESPKEEKHQQQEVTPNDSFLWRRISIPNMHSDTENTITDSPYSFISITMNESGSTYDAEEISSNHYESHKVELVTESQTDSVKIDSNSDFETNLVEAYNKEVLVGFTSKPKTEKIIEDDYEPLEPREMDNNVLIIPVKSIERNSKINCPLPEIPKESLPESPQKDPKDNIYQCLLEMRSHPEGDESSVHNYEMCERLEERTRGDGDSDDGYEYCKSPIKPFCHTSAAGIHIAEDYQPYPPKNNDKNYSITKSVSGASTVSYEKIGSERIYEKIPHRPARSKESSTNYSNRHSVVSSDYTSYNDTENIYDTIKHADGASLSHCYESIPNSPSAVKLRTLRKAPACAAQKRLSFDAVSTLSHSTVSSEQKTNSIYGQRSVGYGGGPACPAPRSEASSDRSDDWVDVSDDEKQDDQKIIIVHERSRGRKSPVSWSQKVRHQWQQSPHRSNDDQVFISSPTSVYIHTSVKSPHYSTNDEVCNKDTHSDELYDKVRLIEKLEQTCWLSLRTVLREGQQEVQDLIAFIENESSSESGHVYESLELPPAAAARAAPLHTLHTLPLPLDDDFDSFDSDSDTDTDDKPPAPVERPRRRSIPRPPSPPAPARHDAAQHTLTKIANAAQKKMRQIKRNLTKRYSEAMDGKTFPKPFASNGSGNGAVYENSRGPPAGSPESPVYANLQPPPAPLYSNIPYDRALPPEPKQHGTGAFNRELTNLIKGDKRSNGRGSPPPRPPAPRIQRGGSPGGPSPAAPRKDSAPAGMGAGAGAGSVSRKNYFSLKSRFRRAASIAMDGSDVPSALKITNSTFYLTDSMDGDSGFSNCSDNGTGVSGESADNSSGSGRLSGGKGPAGGAGLRLGWAESAPCLVPALARPALPPPPPPPLTSPSPSPQTDLSAVHQELKRLLPSLSRRAGAGAGAAHTRTSWYAECAPHTAHTAPSATAPPADSVSSGANTETTSNNSWYGEGGVSGASSTSSSGASSCSLSHSHPASPLPRSLFTHEPLYQFYNAAKVQSVCRETGDSDSDAYEASCGGGAMPPGGPPAAASAAVNPGGPPAVAAGPRPSAMALVAPRGPARTLWCEVPEVINSTVLSSLSPMQKRLQEAKFEVLTSEASYLNSLTVLETHFMAHPAFRDPAVLPTDEWEALFGHILPVRACSQQLLGALEQVWQADVLLGGLCGAVGRLAAEHFHVYVQYCQHQALMVAALHRLRQRPAFVAALRRLESHPACQSLSLHSFLLLPMQRVTRLPLLMDAVLKNLSPEDPEYESCMQALATLNHYVSECNEGARNTERVLELWRVSRAIEFPPHVRNPPALGPACARRDRRPVRWLVRSGEMTQLVWKSDELKLTFGKKFHKIPLHVFLFNDLLVITKKKGEDSYVCVDHCPRSLVEVSGGEEGVGAATGAGGGGGGSGPAAHRHTLLLTLLENHQGRTVEMLMSCSGETDLSRWCEALRAGAGGGGAGEGAGEAVYAGWDCPQVAALYAYAAAQPDELALAEGDVVNVTRKTAEGWYYGERTRDGECGWFPGAYTVEIASAHVRARHLRQRYRLLALSSSYRGHPKRPAN